MGYVGNDLTSTTTTNGGRRVSLRIATSYYYRGSDGKSRRKTEWHEAIAWDNQASFAERNLVKGSHVMIEGSVQYHTYLDNTGHKRYITQIKVHGLINLDR